MGGNLNEKIPFDDESYNLAVSAGTFTLGHVTADCIPNILRVLKPNSLFIFTVRTDIMQDESLCEFYGFPKLLEKFESDGKLKIVEHFHSMPYHLLKGNLDSKLTCTVFVCKKL